VCGLSKSLVQCTSIVVRQELVKKKGLHIINNFIAHNLYTNSIKLTQKKGLRCIIKVRASSKMSAQHEKIRASSKMSAQHEKIRASSKMSAQHE
jgi:hypothetical protein